MIGFGQLSLKEYGVPFSFGGKLGPLLLWPLAFGIGWIFTSRENFFQKFPLIPFVSFLLWIGLTSCFHIPSPDGNTTLLYFLSGLGTFFLMLCALHDSDFLKKILLCLILGMAATVLRGGIDYFFSEGKFIVTGTSERRLFTPFGHPNFLGGALLLILPFAWTFEWKLLCKSGRFWGVVVNGILALGLLLSYSRSAWLGAGISVVCYLFFCFRCRIVWGAVGLVLVGILFSWTLAPLPSLLPLPSPLPSPLPLAGEGQGEGRQEWNKENAALSRFYSLFDFKNDPNVIERIYVWKTAITIAREHPILGIGPGNDRFKKEFTEKREAESMLLMPHAHNVLIQVAVVFGLPGFVFFVLLAGGGIFCCLYGKGSEPEDSFAKSLRVACVCSAAGFFCYSLLDCPIFSSHASPLFWALVGISYFRLKGSSGQG
jgi:putative inorganic carbon (HCO3(-)) transporter